MSCTDCCCSVRQPTAFYDYSQVAPRLHRLGVDMVTATCRQACEQGITAKELDEACDYYERHAEAIGSPAALRLYVLDGGRWPKWVNAKIRDAARKAAVRKRQAQRREQHDQADADRQKWREQYEALESRTGPLFDALSAVDRSHIARYVLRNLFALQRWIRNPTEPHLRETILRSLEEDPRLRPLYETALRCRRDQSR